MRKVILKSKLKSLKSQMKDVQCKAGGGKKKEV